MTTFFLPTNTNIITMERGVQLRCGDEDIFFIETPSPELFAELLEKLTEPTTFAQLLEQSQLDEETLQQFLQELEKRNLLRYPRESATVSGEFGAFLANVAVAGGDCHGKSVVLCGHPKITQTIQQCLRAHFLDVRLSETISPADMAICAVETPDLAFLEQCNQRAVESSSPLLFVDLSHGLHTTIGPFYIPADGSCFHCMRSRLLENTASYREQAAYDQAQRERSSPFKGYGCIEAFRQITAGIATLEALAFLTGFRPLQTLCGALTVDFMQLDLWREQVWRIPWCRACAR